MFEAIFMRVKSMQRVRCSIAWVLSKCEHIVFSKDLEQGVSSDVKVGCVKIIFQGFFEFSDAFSGKGLAFALYYLNDLLFKL